MIIYVDSSAGWIAKMAIRLVEKQRLFESVMGERVDLGFYVLAKKAGDIQKSLKLSIEEITKQEKIAGLLCCPVDKSKVKVEHNYLCCEYNHQYPIHDGFPVMLEKSSIMATK